MVWLGFSWDTEDWELGFLFAFLVKGPHPMVSAKLPTKTAAPFIQIRAVHAVRNGVILVSICECKLGWAV